MPRLTHPEAGTVVTVEGDLAERYVKAGWLEDQPEQAEPERPAPKRRSRTK